MRGNPKQVAASLRARAAALKRESTAAETETAEHGMALAKAMSSGQYSAAQLRRMGHPYAKRAPRPPMDPAVINVQSGNFRRDWQTTVPRWSGKSLQWKLRNLSPEAHFLARQDGTRYMIARPIKSWLIRNLRPGRRYRLLRGIRRALHG